MDSLLKAVRQQPFSKGLLPALAVCFFYLFLRNSGLYPVVFIDEWIYASATRMLPLAEAQVPSYLYFKLYGLTNYCGDGYLECNRVLNELFYVGAGPLIYLLARRVARPLIAGLVALAAVLAPANALTPYFMPEAPYFFAFWLICWTSMWLYDRPTWRRAAVLGGLLGLTAMVKMHAVFLLPGTAVFVAYLAWSARAPQARWQWLRQAALMVLAMLAGFVVLRYSVGFALAGKNGLYLMGKLYSDQAKYMGRAHLPYAQMAMLAMNNLRGHFMMLALLFGVPLAALAAQLLAVRRDGLRRDPAQALSILCLLMFGSALGVTVLFTASNTGLGEMETAARIHTRYYHFALPLLLICGAAAARDGLRLPSLPVRAVIAVLLLALVAHAWNDMLRLFTPNITDSPELRAASLDPRAFAGIALAAGAALLAWVWRPALAARLFLLGFLPVATLVLASSTSQQVRQTIWADAYSKAGKFAHHYLTYGQTARMTIVADDIGGMHRTRFFVENPNTDFLQTPQDTPVPWDKLAPGKTWVLMVGRYALPADARIVARKDEFTLLQTGTRAVAGNTLQFNGVLPGELVERVDGLAGAEPDGSWSDGPNVRIQFAQPLPARMRLELQGRSFGPNVGKDFMLKVGKQQLPFQLAENGGSTALEFEHDGLADTLEFTVPNPVSRASLGLDRDQRLLGMRLEKMRIEARP